MVLPTYKINHAYKGVGRINYNSKKIYKDRKAYNNNENPIQKSMNKKYIILPKHDQNHIQNKPTSNKNYNSDYKRSKLMKSESIQKSIFREHSSSLKTSKENLLKLYQKAQALYNEWVIFISFCLL